MISIAEKAQQACEMVEMMNSELETLIDLMHQPALSRDALSLKRRALLFSMTRRVKIIASEGGDGACMRVYDLERGRVAGRARRVEGF